MSEEDELLRLANEAKKKLGTLDKMGQFLGVSRQRAHKIVTGQGEPTGRQVLMMQKLVQRAAVIAIFCGLSALHSPEAAATNKYVTSDAKSLILKGLPSPACILCKIAITQIIEKAKEFARRLLNMLTMPAHYAG